MSFIRGRVLLTCLANSKSLLSGRQGIISSAVVGNKFFTSPRLILASGSVRHLSLSRKQFVSTSAVVNKNKVDPRGKSTTAAAGDDWKIIYRFKHVVIARAIQKIKVYQTVFSVVVITPGTSYLYQNGLIDMTSYGIALGGSAVACVMLYVMGNIFGKLVGILYTSASRPDKLKIARLTFWGNRIDHIYDVNDFLPLSDMTDNPRNIYFTLKQYSKPDSGLYFSLQYGLIYNLEEMERVFGTLPDDFRLPILADRDRKKEGDKNNNDGEAST